MPAKGTRGAGDWLESGWDLVLHAKARAFNHHRFGVMEKAVQNSGGDGAVVVENAGPLFEGVVGGQHDGSPLVALADDLEEQVGAVLIYGKISDLVQN